MTAGPDGKLVAVFSGHNVEVWEVASGRRKALLAGHEQGGYAVGFSPDSRYLISGSYDQTFKLWNLATGSCTLTFHGYEDMIYTARFLAGRELPVGSSQEKMYFYRFSESSSGME